jgi:hypothetical protein
MSKYLKEGRAKKKKKKIVKVKNEGVHHKKNDGHYTKQQLIFQRLSEHHPF